jgi:hypothetical protein
MVEIGLRPDFTSVDRCCWIVGSLGLRLRCASPRPLQLTALALFMVELGGIEPPTLRLPERAGKSLSG